jgi:purine-binding chemotaxis protein CheW
MSESKQLENEELLQEQQEDTQEGKFLTFSLGNEEYGIEIRHVTEIIGIQNITDLPDMPDFVKGVINLRGKVIPVIDVRLRFNMQERAYDERTCIVVVNINDMAVGLIVDSVSEVIDIPAGDIEPPPRVKKGEASRYIKGLGKVNQAVIILLEIERLIQVESIEQIKESAEAQDSK